MLRAIKDFYQTLAHPERRDQRSFIRGQSVVEFLISLCFVLGFVVMFLRVALSVTDGYLAHYATYMAARSYLVIDEGAVDASYYDNDPQGVVRGVFAKYKKYLFSKALHDLEIIPPTQFQNSTNHYFTGVQFRFEGNLPSPSSMKGVKPQLTSEAFLGKEPTIAGCLDGISRAFREFCSEGGGTECDHATYDDNGC